MFCKHCGKEIDENSLFCSKCGKSLESKEKKEVGDKKKIDTSKIKDKVPNLNFEKFKNSFIKDFKNKKFLKEVLIHTGTAFIIGFLICLILSFSFLGDTNSSLDDMGKQLKEIAPTAEVKLNLNAIDVYNLALQNNFNINFDGTIGGVNDSAKLKFDFSFILLILIPLIGFLIAGFKRYKDITKTKDNIKLFLYSSILFSIVMSILSLITRKVLSISSHMFTKIDFSLKGGFSFFIGLIFIFLLTFIIQVILSLIIKKERLSDILDNKVKEEISAFTYIFKNGFIYSGIFLIIIWILGAVGLLNDNIKEVLREPRMLLFIPNMIIYIFLFLFGNPFNVVIGSEGINLNVFKVSGSGYIFSDLNTSYGLIVLNILIVIGMGSIIYKAIKKLSKENYFKHLIILSGIIAVINTSLAYIARFSIGISGNFETLEKVFDLVLGMGVPISTKGKMFLGTPIIFTFIMSFVFIFIMGVFRYYVGEKSKFLLFENFLEKNKKQVQIIGMILIIIVSIMSFKYGLPNDDSKGAFNKNQSSDYGNETNNYENESNKIIFDEDEIERIFFSKDDTYIIKTYEGLFYFDIDKNKIKELFNNDVLFLRQSYDKEKIALIYSKDSGDYLSVINLKGEELLNREITETLYTIKWSLDDKSILLVGDVHKLLNVSNEEVKTLKVPGNYICFKDDNTLIYNKDGMAYKHDLKTEENKPLNKKADWFIRSGDDIYLLNEKKENEGTTIKDSISNLSGDFNTEYDGIISYFGISNDKSVYYIQGYNNDEILIKAKKDKEYVNINNNIEKVLEFNPKKGQMLVRRKDTEDIFLKDIKNESITNITLDIMASLRLMEVGEE